MNEGQLETWREWLRSRQWTMAHAFLTLFSPEYRRRTLLNSIYLLVSITGLWLAQSMFPPQ